MLRASRWPRQIAKAAVRLLVNPAAGRRCPACGRRAILLSHRVISRELAAAWELSDRWVAWFDEREGRCCASCGNSVRARELARTIVNDYNRLLGLDAVSLADLVGRAKFRELAVAEINSCGALHAQLRWHPNLSYSEYESVTVDIRDESLVALSYADKSFDLVLTSETLEHVPDVDIALREIFRILRPGGRHIFTTPVVCDRPTTRQRARLGADGQVEHLLPPSYHAGRTHTADDYLVFYEFGADFVDIVKRSGFCLTGVRSSTNPALITFVAEKK